MASEDLDTDQEDSTYTRLRGAKWTLAASAFILGVLTFQAPQNWAIALIGFLLIVAVTAFFPRHRRPVRRTEPVPQRNIVWPGNEMKAMCEALRFPAYVIDRGGTLRYANRAASEAFGAAKISDPISFKFRTPEIASLIGDSIASGEPGTMEYHDQIAPERWFWLSVTPIPKPGAAPDFYLLSFVDLTETKRAEQMRSDFIANASHELRTPLASLRGFVETIKGPAANDQKATRQFLDLMLEQAERMARLVDDLLSLSRIEMKAHVKPSGEVSLDQLMRHVTDTLAPLAKKNGMTLEVDFPTEPLWTTGDRDELIQVFENLVENACKYGQPGKKVEISAQTHSADDGEQQVTITVRDFGPGIGAEHLPRLTERFYRVDVDSSRQKQGTGLGLAIVKHILARHGTRLQVSSQLGKGAAFRVSFPLIAQPENVENHDKVQEIQQVKLS